MRQKLTAKESKRRRQLAIEEFEQTLESLTCKTPLLSFISPQLRDIEDSEPNLPFVRIVSCRAIKTNIKIDVSKENFIESLKTIQQRKTLVFKRKTPSMLIYAVAHNGVMIYTRLPA
ncbi:Uncharacterised protein [uncultured archaeon]|nr:Uncharacterised protein [uncultured archaeon]